MYRKLELSFSVAYKLNFKTVVGKLEKCGKMFNRKAI